MNEGGRSMDPGGERVELGSEGANWFRGRGVSTPTMTEAELQKNTE